MTWNLREGVAAGRGVEAGLDGGGAQAVLLRPSLERALQVLEKDGERREALRKIDLINRMGSNRLIDLIAFTLPACRSR